MIKKKRLLWQIYPAFILVALISIVPVTWYATSSLKKLLLSQTATELEAMARLVSANITPFLSPLDQREIDRACKGLGKRAGIRITVISPRGKVYGDSAKDPLRMDNHIDRPEVVQALHEGKGLSMRFSRTVGQQFMYLAIPLNGDRGPLAVLRTAIPVTRIHETVDKIQKRIAITGLLLALCLAVISFLISRRLTKPMENIRNMAENYGKGNFDVSIDLTGIWEIDAVVEAMKKMAQNIGQKIQTITYQRNELEAVLGSMLEGVLAIDPDRKILRINPAAAKIFGVEESFLHGKPVDKLGRYTAFAQFIDAAFHSEDPMEGDMTIDKGDEEKILNLKSAPLLDGNGLRIGILILISDVSNIRRLENMRKDFVANVSHEIRTPITAIKGFVETLRDTMERDSEKALQFLEIIEKHVDRLESIMEDLLALSRIEQQDKETNKIKIARVPVKQVLDDAVQICSEKADSHGVTIHVECDPHLQVKAAPRLLCQAIMNLLDNAIKHSKQGATVWLTAISNDNHVEISVADEGSGIDPRYVDRIFERFYRIDKARSRATGGTGLGLAIVKHIVQIHGGSVDVESRLGKGSVFTIYLPK